MAVNLIDSNDVTITKTGNDITLNVQKDSSVSTSSTKPVENQAITNYVNDSVSGDLVVDSIKSKNLFSGFLSGAYNSSTGAFDTSTSGIATPKIEVESGEKYCLSGIQNGNTIRILFWNDNTFVSSTTLTTQTENVITMLGNRFAFQTATSTPYTNIQLEKGEVKTDYRPFENLNGEDLYSGIETRIGTWTNGKPLYRKVLTGTLSSGDLSIDLSSLNIAILTDSYGRCGTTGNYRPLNFYLDGYFVSTRYSGGSMYIAASSAYAGEPFELVIEYTKSTD